MHSRQKCFRHHRRKKSESNDEPDDERHQQRKATEKQVANRKVYKALKKLKQKVKKPPKDQQLETIKLYHKALPEILQQCQMQDKHPGQLPFL